MDALIKISLKRHKLDKELRSFRRWRRWLWLRHPRHWWWMRKKQLDNPCTTAATGKAPQLSKSDVDKMLKNISGDVPERRAVLVSGTVAEALKKHPPNAQDSTHIFASKINNEVATTLLLPSLWSGIPVFQVDDEAYNRIDLDVNKAFIGTEDDIMRIRGMLKSHWASDRMLELIKDKISKLEEMP